VLYRLFHASHEIHLGHVSLGGALGSPLLVVKGEERLRDRIGGGLEPLGDASLGQVALGLGRHTLVEALGGKRRHRGEARLCKNILRRRWKHCIADIGCESRGRLVSDAVQRVLELDMDHVHWNIFTIAQHLRTCRASMQMTCPC
jgi:hypothetical protein